MRAFHLQDDYMDGAPRVKYLPRYLSGSVSEEGKKGRSVHESPSPRRCVQVDRPSSPSSRTQPENAICSILLGDARVQRLVQRSVFSLIRAILQAVRANLFLFVAASSPPFSPLFFHLICLRSHIPMPEGVILEHTLSMLYAPSWVCTVGIVHC
ncbi:hypothetical protein QBC47DRAFT_378134 [Echria macrotheca]|uniref:Uncharacterized protein n=1 Tax=Echria macrotheca TaxID=438768 RepID=A0AAJ0BES4_9PEZI|nr:hypothetical protein QBC47DRAFT_378134 [Echria macrotheca]